MKQLRFAAILLLLPALVIAGCSQGQIAALTQTLGNSAASLAAAEGNSSLAGKLRTDTSAAVAAVTNWKTGAPATEAIEALNLVEDDLNLIPITSAYAPLIDLAIGTVESILALLPQSPAPAIAAHTTHRHVVLASTPKTAKEFKTQWNALTGDPSLKVK